MSLKAKIVPYSSIVGSAVSLSDRETGAVKAIIMVSVPNPSDDYKEIAQPIIETIERAFNFSTPQPDKTAPVGEDVMRCTICGFVVDTRYKAEKPTADFTTAGRHKHQAPSLPPLGRQPSKEASGQ